jgi:hypothetical protein
MLAQAPNCTVDVYRGFNAANPYQPPNPVVALKGAPGFLAHHVRNGKFGYFPAWAKEPIYWSNILEVQVETDIRDGYNSKLNTYVPTNGDTLFVADYPYPGCCCAFLCVLVQRRGRGTPSDHLRCYLDRVRPVYDSPCPTPATSCCGITGSTTPILHVTFTDQGGCSCLAGSYAIGWNSISQAWLGDIITSCGGNTLGLTLTCSNNVWALTASCSQDSFYQGTAPSSVVCSPLTLTFPVSSSLSFCCSGKVQAVVTL